MTWLKLDDQYFDHPKVAVAGRDGALLDIAGMLYCARFLTDGHIPANMVRRLAPIDDPAACAATLVAVGRWHEVEGGYAVHDYLKYNPTREKVLIERARDLARKKGLPYPDAPAADPWIATSSRQPGADSYAQLEPILAIINTAPRDFRTNNIDWKRVYDTRQEEEHRQIEIAEAYQGLISIGVEEAVALDLARTRTAACLDWIDNPDRYKNAKNAAGLIVKRLRALPEEKPT